MLRKKNKKSNTSAFLGAAFLMGTTAIGPGFLVQNSQFTSDLGASFGCVILVSVIMSIIAQMNIWRVLCVTGMRGQDLANRLLPGLGYFISFLVILGAFAFNIGNVGGGALGLNVLFGLPVEYGCIIMAAFTIGIFTLKNAKRAIDIMTRTLCGIMIAVIVIMIFIVRPPAAMAVKNTFIPEAGINEMIPAAITLIGATIGGYVTFSGAHRLIDEGTTGMRNIKNIEKSSVTGIAITTIVRVLFFMAVLGVVAHGAALDPDNPAADAFCRGAGKTGYIFAGIVMVCASITPIISAAYTSVSFIKTFHPFFAEHENAFTAGAIAISAFIMASIGKPAELLIIASALNGFILPLVLAVCLAASGKKEIMGEEYTHPVWLKVTGIAVAVIMAYFSVKAFAAML